LSFTDDYEQHMVERLARTQQQKESVMRAARQTELMHEEGCEEMDEHERRWQARAEQLDRAVAYLAECASALQRLLYDYRAVNTKRGEVYGNRFQLTQGVPIRIDLVRPEESANPPASIRLDLPRRPLTDLILINEGAGNLSFTTNDKSDKAGTFVKAGDTLTLAFGEPILERINFSVDATLTLNMIVII
jgi:hypothetical protein